VSNPVLTVLAGEERETLRSFLDKQRDVLIWKLAGLGDADLRRPITPSGTNLLGLVKHLAAAEYRWFGATFGRPTEQLPEHDDDYLQVDADETTPEVMAYYERARRASDQTVADLELDATGTAWTGDTVSLRWVLVHMIEETARHAGHADIVRELIDNTTGYLPGNAWL
jgi:uncharacterized damage-inducible protein DinB